MGVASQYNMSDSFFLWHVWKWVIDLLMCVLFACAATKPAIVTNDTASITSDLLWPKPTSANFGSNIYTVDQNLEFTKDGPGGNSDVFEAAIARYKALIFKTPSPFYPSGNEGRASGTLSSVTVTISSDDETLDLHTNESYTLVVSKGHATLTAQTVYGALRGIETFSQLIFRTPDGGYAINEVNEISDKPRYNYRGIMIDTSRHFLNKGTILTHLDAMAYNKFNILHWHIVDDQSFPYQSTTFPNMSAQGAFDAHHIYSQDDVLEVIAKAKERGIRVIPEFDTPGHTQSWGKGQPDLLTKCYTNGKFDGTYGPINPIPNSTWTFMKAFYQEIAKVFPDRYMHLGGDEVNFTCWQSNPDIQAWMKKNGHTDYAKLEEYYENNLIALVNNLNKSYIVWQEIFDNGLKIKTDTVIDVWKSGWQKEMAAVTSAGYNVILSACWYLNKISYGEDWKAIYRCEPQGFVGTTEQYQHIVGGHACLWGAWVDSTNFMTRMWPRASAVGERLWSTKDTTDTDAASVRLHNHKCRMLSRGIQAEPVIRSQFCSYEWPSP